MSAARLWLRVGPDGALEWLLRDAHNRVAQGPDRLDPRNPPIWPQAQEVILVWADESLLLRRAQLPAGGRNKWRQGLPYLAEDWVAADVADLHVCAPARLAGEHCWVAVVERSRLEHLLQMLADAGLNPDRIIPEAAFLGPGRSVDVLIDGGHASFSSDAGLAGSCEVDLLSMLAGRDLDSLRLLSTGNSELPAARQDGIDSALRWVSLQPITNDLVDLRQGSYARQRQAGGLNSWWRMAAGVLLAALALHMLLLVAEVWRLSSVQAQLRSQIETEFRRAMGDQARMVDPVFQVKSEFQRVVQGGGGSADALDMLAALAPLLASDSRLVLVSFEYREQALELAVRAPDATRFDGFREQVQLDATLAVEVASTQYDGDGFTGRVRIRRSP